MTAARSREQLPAWQALQRHAAAVEHLDIVAEFTSDPDRAARLTFNAAGLSLDLSKNRIRAETLEALVALADEVNLRERITGLLSGSVVNVTENRAALHTALRAASPPAEVAREQQRLAAFTEAVRSGRWTGFAGKPVTALVNIGIGGSDLGPKLLADALRFEQRAAPEPCFVANVDGGELHRVLTRLDPGSTLFVVASKSFTTPETLRNATTARDWIEAAGATRADIAKHFVAVSANRQAAERFGIAGDNVFAMWDWVGGRYSVWSAIGLPVMLAYGMPVFRRLLAGAERMDRHFAEAPLEENLPVLLALIGVWHVNFVGAESHGVIPYDDRLVHLPAYLQQLEMESNGKRVTMQAEALDYMTAPVVWGGVGTNAQHAFFQLLHQGTRCIPLDLIAALRHPVSPRSHHDALIANFIAQSEALLHGRSFEQALAAGTDTDPARAEMIARHRVMPGNRPHTLIVMDELTPETLGALIALYEHKTFVQGVIWDVNSFDQWGVELGKTLAAAIEREFRGEQSGTHDASTAALIARYRALRDGA